MVRRLASALRTLALAAAVLLPVEWPAGAEDSFIIVQSTTSTQNSGLFDHILPAFHQVAVVPHLGVGRHRLVIEHRGVPDAVFLQPRAAGRRALGFERPRDGLRSE